MVNLRKIGAVATGALFVGATIGMASAVTVPDAFQNSLLADNGVAKAQLVVGANAPGKIEDKASAEIIQSAVASELAESGTGGQIKIEFGDENLDEEGGNDDDFEQTYLSDIGSGNTLAINGSGLLFDANSDGDVKDSGDYTLYDAVYVSDDIGGTIRFVYNLSDHIEAAYDGNLPSGTLGKGVVVKVKGSKYAITDLSELDSGEISLGPAIAKTIYDGGATADPDNAVVIAENYKVFLKDMTGSATLMFYEGNSLLAQYTNFSSLPKKLNDIDDFDAGGLEDKYNIYMVENDTETVAMTFVDKDQIIDLIDEDEGIMGYDLVWVNNTDNWNDGVALLGPVVQLVKDDTIDLEGTYYQLKYTNTRKLDIKRKETKTKSSGTKWKDTKNDFLNDDVWISAVGGQIKIEYGDENLDEEGGNDDDFALSYLSDIGSGNTLAINGSGLLFDANSDGDVKDSGDYTLYDAVYVSDDIGGTIRFVYNLSNHIEAAYDGNLPTGTLGKGVVAKVKGSKYAITDISEFDSGEVSLGPAIAKTIYDGGAIADPDNAVVIAENYKVFYKKPSGNSGTLMFYEGNSLLAQYANFSGLPKELNDIDDFDAGGLEDKYNIYMVENDTDTVAMTFVDKDQITDLIDEDEGIMGYDLVWVNNTDNWNDGVALLSQVVQLVKDDTIDLEGTYYQLKYTNTRKLDIKRKETKTKSSGTKWKDTKNDFMNDDVWISVTGGDTVTPDVEIVDDADADTDGNNLFLIGGPVANTLTADLVTQEKSTVEWETSDGDIEVIADAFATGKTAVIVAGKTRTETEVAAQALADAL